MGGGWDRLLLPLEPGEASARASRRWPTVWASGHLKDTLLAPQHFASEGR